MLEFIPKLWKQHLRQNNNHSFLTWLVPETLYEGIVKMPISSQKQSKQSNNLLSMPTALAHMSLTINTQSDIFYH